MYLLCVAAAAVSPACCVWQQLLSALLAVCGSSCCQPCLLCVSAADSPASSHRSVSGYDCGMYVVSLAEYLTNVFLHLETTPIMELITPAYVTNKRRRLRSLVLQLAS